MGKCAARQKEREEITMHCKDELKVQYTESRRPAFEPTKEATSFVNCKKEQGV